MNITNYKQNQGKWRNSHDDVEVPEPRLSRRERNTVDNSPQPERAILVAVCTAQSEVERCQESLDELAFLLDTAGGVAVRQVMQRLPRPDSRTYIGSGKIEEVKEFKQALDADMLVFDDELTPTQLRNLERDFSCRILDRTTLILDIFAKRARTSTAKTQVELAQLQYMLPRLTRMWTHLERQRGGIGMRGPGETQIETDRRLITEKIVLLKERLASIDRQKVQQRKSREALVRVALVGYTNVGKSTLMNLISKSDVFAENKLFATLDTTVRKVVIGNLPFLLSDTVGFIRKLPHGLVESFKSTLDEVCEADILIHVVDISHPSFEQQIQSVNATLAEIGAAGKPTLLLFNKCDAFRFQPKDPDDLTPVSRDNWSLNDWEAYWQEQVAAMPDTAALFVSAHKRDGIDALRDVLYHTVRQIHSRRFPYDNFLW
ncbi:MAG: GTP-binding protein HflX [bacterium P3]|nr:MAG: GTP-binding protein HflX [bacterium P3]KWW41995.1 MAG: GTP-binding protein HflX [bacterium F083]